MKKILVACETIEDEVTSAIRRLKRDLSVIWLEGGLHSSPDRLRAKLAGVLEEVDGQCDLLIFTLGNCGGGVSGLRTGNYTTVLPLADDCLSLLLGSMTARRQASNPPTYFLTAGWLKHENNVVDSYLDMVDKYGESRADRINKLMLANYRRFGLIDTGVYDLLAVEDKVRPLADKMALSVETLPGGSSWLDRLITGPYDAPELFLKLPPKSELNFETWLALLDQPGRSENKPGDSPL